MKRYDVIIRNEVGMEVGRIEQKAENPNRAIMKALERTLVYEGDTISVQEFHFHKFED